MPVVLNSGLKFMRKTLVCVVLLAALTAVKNTGGIPVAGGTTRASGQIGHRGVSGGTMEYSDYAETSGAIAFSDWVRVLNKGRLPEMSRYILVRIEVTSRGGQGAL